MMKCIRMVLFQLYSGIDGPVDMKLTCGIIVVEEKASLGKEDKVSNLLSLVFRFCILVLIWLIYTNYVYIFSSFFVLST